MLIKMVVLLQTCFYFLEPQILQDPLFHSPRPLAMVGGIGLRAQAAICMQIAWDAIQMRDLKQMYALLGGRPGHSPH